MRGGGNLPSAPDPRSAAGPRQSLRGFAILGATDRQTAERFVFSWGLPTVKSLLNKASLEFNVPALHLSVLRAYPVVNHPEPEAAKFTFNWLSATGTGLLVTGIVSGLLLGLNPLELARIFARTLWRVRWSLLSMASMLSLGFTTRCAGIDATMGLRLRQHGRALPLLLPTARLARRRPHRQ